MKEPTKKAHPASVAISASARGIAKVLHRTDERGVDTLYQHVLVAARSVGVFERRKMYSLQESAAIVQEVARLFPRRGED